MIKFHLKSLLVLLPVLTSAILISACSGPVQTAPATPTARIGGITYGQITPGPHIDLPDLSTVIDVPPFPYSMPLPPAVASPLDGLYSRLVPMEGTPTPCKRCAGYRIEGGVWTLFLDKGVFKVFQRESEFQAVGSFSVSGNNINFFNDPYCEEDMAMVGKYTYALDARGQLRLTASEDACSIGLRSRNLTSGPWVKTPLSVDERARLCQPPTREAAITDHWVKPPYC